MPAKPTIAKFCATFLKEDMLHVYRQISGLSNYRPFVLTRKRESITRFPFPEEQVEVMPKAPLRFLRRAWFRQLLRRPIPASSREVHAALNTLSREDAQLLHVYFANVASDLLPLLRQSPIPTIVSVHGADAAVDMDKPGFRKAMVEALSHPTLVLARSESLLDALEELGCPREKLRLQRTGLPLEDWPLVARKPPIESGEWHLLQTCRAVAKKGIGTTLRSFATILNTHPKARLTIAGGGPLLSEMEALAAELQITENVDFTGFADQSEVRRLAESAHLFFHPSETDADGNVEGVPNAMIEAMATGLPSLGTYHAGIPELIDDGISGILVPERDHTELANRALKLMADPALYQSMTTASRSAVEKKFSRKASIAQLEACYDEAIALKNAS